MMQQIGTHAKSHQHSKRNVELGHLKIHTLKTLSKLAYLKFNFSSCVSPCKSSPTLILTKKFN
jgi:hypothetical protein